MQALYTGSQLPNKTLGGRYAAAPSSLPGIGMRSSSETYGGVLSARGGLYILAFILLGAFVVLRDKQLHCEQRMLASLHPQAGSVQPQPVTADHDISKCEYPIVYNKPHKTGSTMIQKSALRWARREGRPAYRCSLFIQKARFQVRECVPHDSSGCAIVATHIELDDITTELLTDRIGKYKTITSTRRPDHRILSLYMQNRHLNIERANNDRNGTMADFKTFLKDFNPWEMYNYHTGGFREGSCPISLSEEHLLVKLATRYDIVLDADLPEESNIILESHNLFQLSVNKSVNSRGSTMFELDEEAKELIKSKMCVEEKLHSLFRIRMASAYEKTQGEDCLSEGRNPVPCFKE